MNGPLVTEYKADQAFQVYRSGVLMQDVLPEDNKPFIDEDNIIIPSHGDVQLDDTETKKNITPE